MKLREACELAIECGLETIEEAIANIQYHAAMLFPYNQINDEFEELYLESKNVSLKMKAEDYINGKKDN